jgi:hypothetical protein
VAAASRIILTIELCDAAALKKAPTVVEGKAAGADQ